MAKNNRDIFGDDVELTRSEFESLLDESSGASGSSKIRPGSTLIGKILSIGRDEVFVSLGMPQDGIIPKAALLDKDKNFNYKVGDAIEVTVMRVQPESILLVRKNVKASGQTEDLQDAFEMEMPVEGKVLEVIKGGFRVDIMGQRAFCPISQIDLSFVTDPALYVGKRFDFIITKLQDRDLVVSRRKILELERAEKEGEFLKKVQIGDVVEGQVSRLEKFGAFVNLGAGVEGLIHLSELSWTRVRHPEEVISVGTQVRVKVLKVDEEGERLKISLSLKEGGAEMDPWFDIENKLSPGKILTGTVDKKEAFGLFVVLLPGINGLLPKSSWRDVVDGAQYENKKRGDSIQVQIATINKAERKISLMPPGEAQDISWQEHAPKKQNLGTFGDLLKNIQVKKS